MPLLSNYDVIRLIALHFSSQTKLYVIPKFTWDMSIGTRFNISFGFDLPHLLIRELKATKADCFVKAESCPFKIDGTWTGNPISL